MTFASEEYRRRREALRGAADAAGIAAVVVTSESNIRYYAGIETPSFASNSRPYVLAIAVEREPTLFVARSHLSHAERLSQLDEIKSYDGFEAACIDLVMDHLRSTGLTASPIGFELNHEMRAGLTYTGLARLLAAAAIPAVDASPILWRQRVRKSAAELDLMKATGAVAGLAFDSMLAATREGATQRDLFEAFATRAILEGADRVGYFAIHSGDGSDRRPNAPPTSRRLVSGDIAWVDAGVVCSGYWSDFTRMVAIGEPSRHRLDSYRFVYEASRALMAELRPGVPASAIMAAATAVFERAGRQIGNSSRVGHGVGLEITEPPSLISWDETMLTEGMVIAVEPAVSNAGGYFVVEENLALVREGAVPISPPAPPNLPVVG